ncbi:MAG: hypothetical protein IH984_07525 [Planctomycetes bacterium]|nr:hypothetical protein [Planctomycetota bacterium]
MDAAASKTHLRLVGADDPSAMESMRASQAVARENAAASRNEHLDPTDPRWIIAAKTHAQLQGSALTHERRQRVLRLAHRLGVRPFEANVIIAIVQDKARQGETLSDATPTLKMLRDPREDRKTRNSGLVRWLWAIATATLANILLIWWLMSG